MTPTRPELVGSFGMVASTHWLASHSGMAVLEAGGNAFDAAVATGLVLHVVEPHMSGLGGEVPVLGWSTEAAAPFVVCGQGVAPSAATPEAFAALGLDLVPGNGFLPAVVPGAFGAWMLLLRDFGSLPLREVTKYAIGYARSGFVMLPAARRAVAEVADLFERHWPSSRAVWLPRGRPPADGAIMRNPDLAQCLERIVATAESASRERDQQIDAARRAFYEGFVAEAIDCFYGTEVMDCSGVPHQGLLRYEDMRGWQATLEQPETFVYHGRTVLKAGPWSQGPVFLQQLALLAGFDLASLGPSSSEYVHLVTECSKLAFADREAYYGDPSFSEVPMAELLADDYNARRRAAVGATAIVDGLHPGRVRAQAPRLPRYTSSDGTAPAGLGEPMARTRGSTHGRDTCHLDVVDRFGNMVSATPSGGWLQDSPAVPELGFSVSTRGQMFWLDEGLPNSLAPSKRPRTTLTPTLVLRDGSPHLAFGSPGGDMQDQWSLSFFLRHLHHGMGLQESIEAPAFHTTHMPSSFYPRQAQPGRLHVESRMGPRVVDELRSRGHRVQVEGPWALGRICAVGLDHRGVLRAAASPRGSQAYAAGR